MIALESAAGDRVPLSTTDLAATLAAERPRLVRLCARLAHDWDAAEDLAQETLAQAWRSRAKLREAEGLPAWLNATAHYICLRWLRRRTRDLHLLQSPADEVAGPGAAAPVEELPAYDDEPVVVLERGELAELLDRALALLPAETRDLLIETYIRERSQREVAARRGLSEGVLRARLHRGRLALRRVLTDDLRGEALAADILPPDTARWRDTRIWCPFCGRHPLAATIDRATGEYSYRCAGDCQPGSMLVGMARDLELLTELASPKAILTRHCAANFVGYRAALAGVEVTCPHCGSACAIRQPRPDGSGGTPVTPLFVNGVYLACPTCGPMAHVSPWHLTLQAPSALQFWRRHPRMRALPTAEVEHAGRPALVTGFESVQSAARLEIVSARDTYAVLAVSGDLAAPPAAEEARA